MAKWFVEYSIFESTPTGWAAWDGDKFFTLMVERLSLQDIEEIMLDIAILENTTVDAVSIDNIAKINTN